MKKAARKDEDWITGNSNNSSTEGIPSPPWRSQMCLKELMERKNTAGALNQSCSSENSNLFRWEYPSEGGRSLAQPHLQLRILWSATPESQPSKSAHPLHCSPQGAKALLSKLNQNSIACHSPNSQIHDVITRLLNNLETTHESSFLWKQKEKWH